jgi:hypothetical protein
MKWMKMGSAASLVTSLQQAKHSRVSIVMADIVVAAATTVLAVSAHVTVRLG